MRFYKVVGWYCDNPHDGASIPYSLVVYVHAENEAMAFDDGDTALRKAAANPNALMNWYVKEVGNTCAFCEQPVSCTRYKQATSQRPVCRTCAVGGTK